MLICYKNIKKVWDKIGNSIKREFDCEPLSSMELSRLMIKKNFKSTPKINHFYVKNKLFFYFLKCV